MKKSLEQQPVLVTAAGESTPGNFQTSYSEQYPCWGKPGYYNFKHREPRVTSDKLPFRAETTYQKSYEVKPGTASGASPSKTAARSVWAGLEFS